MPLGAAAFPEKIQEEGQAKIRRKSDENQAQKEGERKVYYRKEWGLFEDRYRRRRELSHPLLLALKRLWYAVMDFIRRLSVC